MEDVNKEYEQAIYDLAIRIKEDFIKMLEDGENYIQNADYSELFSPRHEGSYIRASKVAKLFIAVETFEDEYHRSTEEYYPVATEDNMLKYPIAYPFRLDMPSTKSLIKAIDEELDWVAKNSKG